METAPHTSSAKDHGYLDFFRMDHHPFPVAPDDRNFYVSRHINEVIAEIVHGVVSRKGFIVLTGEVGLGKTTISRRVIKILENQGVQTSLVLHTTLQQDALLKEILRDFGVQASGDDSGGLGGLMHRLNQFLLEKNQQGKNCAIVIDDAQNLNSGSLELIRMISNLEADQQKLVQILLVGQPELAVKLGDPELRQLNSRIIIKKEVKPLDLREVSHYILFKLNLAGDSGLTRLHGRALKKIRKYSGGNFRKLNVLMDRALYVAFVRNTREIGARIIHEAHADLCGPRPILSGQSVGFGLASALGTIALAAVIYLGLNGNAANIASATPGTRATQPVAVRTDTIPPLSVNHAAAAVVPAGGGPVEPEIVSFLGSYGLGQYGEQFFAALKTRQLDQIRNRIFKETGYRLMAFETLPEAIMGRYGVLLHAQGRDAGKKRLLFWKPGIDIKRFYYGYTGAEIVRLQQALAGLDLYTGEMDGIVGRNLMKALVAFQQRSNIEVTGVPDPKTLFFICEYKEFANNDRG